MPRMRFREKAKVAIAACVLGAGLGGGATAEMAAEGPQGGAAGKGPVDPPRNARLMGLEANTWIKLCAFKMDGGASEVRWGYDSNRKRYVRVGGCTNKYSNEVWSFDLGTETFTCNLPFAEGGGGKSRPGHGCNRSVCYDPDNKCVWCFGGATSYSPPGNILGLWKGVGSLGAGDWEHIDGVPNLNSGCLAYDPAAKKIICMGCDMGTWLRTIVFDPVAKNWHYAAAPSPAGEATMPESYPGLIYVPELKGCLFLSARPTKEKPSAGMLTWHFDTAAERWCDLRPGGPFPSPRKKMGYSFDDKNRILLAVGGGPDNANQLNDTWVYLVKENQWTQLKPKASPPERRGSMLLAYDPEHDVHVLAQPNGGAGGGEVWVYRYK